jgi:hypothetical protein
MAAALLALISWQAAPWLMANREGPQSRASQPEKSAGSTAQSPPVASAASQPAAVPQAPAVEQPPKQEPAASETGEAKKADVPVTAPAVSPPPVMPTSPSASLDAKPSPMPKSPPAPVRQPAPVTVQPVAIISSPTGATVTMDDRADAACKTPCSLDAAPGRHRFSYVLPGYQLERREYDVGTGPLELPIVILRAHGGVLALSSVPPGAAVLVNGRKIDQQTPAMLQLAPGSYQITVEKNGRQSSGSVEIRPGDTKSLRITLGQ